MLNRHGSLIGFRSLSKRIDSFHQALPQKLKRCAQAQASECEFSLRVVLCGAQSGQNGRAGVHDDVIYSCRVGSNGRCKIVERLIIIRRWRITAFARVRLVNSDPAACGDGSVSTGTQNSTPKPKPTISRSLGDLPRRPSRTVVRGRALDLA